MGAVRGGKPGHGEHRLFAILVLAEELEGGIHGDYGARSLDAPVFSIVAEVGIVIEEVQPREPLVEPGSSGGSRAVGLDRADVPLAEMSRDVARISKLLGDGPFVGAHVVAVVGDVCPEGMPAGHHARPCRGANRSAGIETAEDNAGLGHLVEVRGFHEGVTGEPAVAVSMVVRHDENDVGAFLCLGDGKQPEEQACP